MSCDYFIAGRTRNRDNLRIVVDSIRKTGKTASCFIDNSYDSDGIAFSETADAEAEMQQFESLDDWQTNPTFREMFEVDMQALRDSKNFILVFPSGLSAHMELGVAYGMGKPCYAIGVIENVESLYLMIDEIFPNVESFIESKIGVNV